MSLPVRSEWVSLRGSASQPAAPVVTVLQDDQSSTVLRVTLSGFNVTSLQANGQSYQSIDLLSEIKTTEPGSPEVPYVAQMVAIPDRGGVVVEVVETGDVQTFGGYGLPPARQSWKEGTPEPPYVENAAAYRSTAAYPSVTVHADEPVVFRDLRVARLAIHPVRYVPATKELQVTASMTVRLRYGFGRESNPRTAVRRAIPPSFGAVYRSSLINYGSVLERLYGGQETGREVLLCVVPDTFAVAFKPYADWKNKTGTYVKVTKFSEIGANSTNPDIIKNYLAQCYHTWQYPPTFVLLVGDYGQAPIQPEATQGFANENYFVEIDGNDVFPEMYFGRFTQDVNSINGLQTIINKVIKYERIPYRGNLDWFKHAVVCANTVDPTQSDTKRWVTGVMRNSGGFTVDTLLNLIGSPCAHNLTEVITAINSGRGYLNYRGEGGSAGWWASCYPFSTTDVPSISNGDMATFVTSIGCGVAMFNASGGNCFGEAWMELGTPTATRGSCVFIGPTWGNTHAIYNNEIDKGLYVALLQEGMDTPGQTLLRGKIRMYNTYGGGDPQVLWHFRTYTILADPSTRIWKNVPRKVDVTYTPVVSTGYDQVEVSVVDSATHAPVDSAEICIAGDSVYVTGYTDASGHASIPIVTNTLDTLTFCVHGVSVVPAEGTIAVIAQGEHVAPLGDPVVTDLDGNLDGRINPNEHIQIAYVLKNWGNQTATNVQATLSVLDTTHVSLVNEGPVQYGTLPPGVSGPGTGTPLQFYVKSTTPVGYAIPLRLNVTSLSSSWIYSTTPVVEGCDLRYSSVTIDDVGSPHSNGRLDPGETALLYVTITNQGQDAAPNVAGVLRCADPHILVLDSLGSFGTLGIGGSSTNTMNYFIVAVTDSCPVGASPVFTLALETQNGSYAYSVARDFSIPVGLPSGTDPTGPDAYGYYFYSNDDSLYAQCPRYSWVEIRSVGTLVPYVAPGDFTATETLPFTFKYYGRNYTSVRVSSDGWLAFGSGTQTSFTNYSLPHSDNITNMVGVFWDDLFEGSSNPTSKLLYYNDATQHRFIVEWDSVGHYSGTSLRESFQAILLDPAYYPTPTGDGEIILQYKVVGMELSCTVGAEDSTQAIGQTYLYNATYNPTASTVRAGTAIRLTTAQPSLGSTNVTVAVLIDPGWNIVSNPVVRPDSINGVRRLYPHAVTDYAFRFDPGVGYSSTSVMPNGPGFWAKFPGGELNSITGVRLLRDSVSVDAGWNIIGSTSSYLDTSSIQTIPAGLRGSSYFGYSGGYNPVIRLAPGQGYWVKARGSGQFVLGLPAGATGPGGDALQRGGMEGLNSMTIRDSRGGSQTLYFGVDPKASLQPWMFAMPPLPPVGAFDARFETPDGGSLVRVHSSKVTDGIAFPVTIQSDAYPLTVSWNVDERAAVYELTDGMGDKVFAPRTLNGEGSMKIADASLSRIIMRLAGNGNLPKEFALLQNYPNPFNPATTIRYDLPVNSRVSLKVFNILGQEVAALVNEDQKAGYRSVNWNASSFATGVYFYRLEARPSTSDGWGQAGSYVSVKKLLLLK